MRGSTATPGDPIQARLDGDSTEQEILHRVTFKAGGGGSWVRAHCLTQRGSRGIICQHDFPTCPCVS